jgi:cytochrome c1
MGICVRQRALKIAICMITGIVCGCKGPIAKNAAATASADRGKATIEIYGCGKCHTIPGIRGANGVVGPPLQSIASRTYIAGNFANTHSNLVHWVMSPQSMKPKTAMPSLGLSEPQANDVAVYLESLR